MTTTRFTASALLAANEPKSDSSDGKKVRLRRRGHRLDHRGQRARLAVQRALPGPAPRPGLQHGHPDEEDPEPAEQQPAQSRPPPGALGQRDQRPRHDVEQHRPGRPGQPAQPGREDPAERLAEHPHDQPPAHAGQPGQPGPRPPGRENQPGADPDLDPYRGRARLDGVIGPDRPAPVDHVLHPPRRSGGCRLDDLRGQPPGHLRLRLQDPVDDPDHPEPHPQQPPPPRFGSPASEAPQPPGARPSSPPRPRSPSRPGYLTSLIRTDGLNFSVGSSGHGTPVGPSGRASPGDLCGWRGELPGAYGRPDEPAERDDEEGNPALVQQRGPERGDQRRIGRTQARVHAGHVNPLLSLPACR